MRNRQSNSKSKNSTSTNRKRLTIKQPGYKKNLADKTTGRVVHTARINLTQGQILGENRGPVTNLKKYSCIAAKEPREAGSRNKMNISKSEKARKGKEAKKGRDSSKRKRNKRTEILEYLED